MHQSTRYSLVSSHVLSALLLPLCLSEMASASPTVPVKTYMDRRATTARAAATANTSAATKGKGLSLVLIIVIVVVVVVALLAIGGLLYFCYRKRAKSRKNKGLNMSTIGVQPSSTRPLSGTARREPEWWQPSDDGAHTVVSHTNIPYSHGGHGYTYGQTLDPASAGMPGTRTSTYSRHAPPPPSPHSRDENVERPFQIPVLAPPPPPSISPSYHSQAGEGETHVPMPLYSNSTGYAQPNHNQPLSGVTSLRRQETTLQYLQPQATGTSMYSSPYEVSAMTQSTSGHPGT